MSRPLNCYWILSLMFLLFILVASSCIWVLWEQMNYNYAWMRNCLSLYSSIIIVIISLLILPPPQYQKLFNYINITWSPYPNVAPMIPSRRNKSCWMHLTVMHDTVKSRLFQEGNWVNQSKIRAWKKIYFFLLCSSFALI